MRWTDRLALAVLALAGCSRTAPPPLLGTLEWDRIGVAAEASETILRIAVAEGDTVAEGQLLLELDPRRTEAQLAQAEAEARRAQAQLDELTHGARIEALDAAQAALARAEATAANAARDRERAADLRARGLVAQADLDHADTALRQARADLAAARARWAELAHGTRAEQLDAARAALAAAESSVTALRLTRERLDVRAPRAGRVDTLPFKLGDQPPKGATLVALLSGEAPYARVFVPAAQRAALAPGTRLRVRVQGIAEPFEAHLRRLASEASFTPYYALSGDDASRLAYRAELELTGEAARRLAAGLPVQAEIVP